MTKNDLISVSKVLREYKYLKDNESITYFYDSFDGLVCDIPVAESENYSLQPIFKDVKLIGFYCMKYDESKEDWQHFGYYKIYINQLRMF